MRVAPQQGPVHLFLAHAALLWGWVLVCGFLFVCLWVLVCGKEFMCVCVGEGALVDGRGGGSVECV